MSAVATFLWPKNSAALQEYLRNFPSKLYNPRTLLEMVPEQTRAQIVAESKERASSIAGDLVKGDWNSAAGNLRTGRSEIEDVLLNKLSEKLSENMLMVAGLDAAHERDGIDLLVLNEDVLTHAKTAANWAKARGVPSLVVSHSLITGRLMTVHLEDNADRLAVFGARGAKGYLDLGMAPDRIFVTGNPAWDVYAGLVSQRDSIRSEFNRQYGLGERDHLVLFATTWSNYRSAFDDDTRYETSLRAAVRSVRELRELGVPIRLVVKERPPNAEQTELRARIFREEAGGQDPIVVFDNLERWIVAADAAISFTSNVAVEAMIAGTIAINVWTPSSWFSGPYYGAEDGVLEASYDKLSEMLARALGDPALRSQLQTSAQARLNQSAMSVGNAAANVAALMMQTRRAVAGKQPHYAWQTLSAAHATSGRGKVRMDIVGQIRERPKLVLDLGCNTGATGSEIKKRFQDATIVGIEANDDAAKRARERLDRVVIEDPQTLDFEKTGFTPGSIDLVVCAETLSRITDPWTVLARLKPFLKSNAQIIASIPNMRNLSFLAAVASGDWEYTVEGQFDIGQIRFFTKKTVLDLFVQTGYKVRSLSAAMDERVPPLQAPAGKLVNVDMPRLQFKSMSEADLTELRALHFIIDATPAC